MVTVTESTEREKAATAAAGRTELRPTVPAQSLSDCYQMERNTMGRSITVEPNTVGLYWDRDGDIWQREEAGWRLILQSGVAVDPISLWEWEDGHVQDYAPFTPMAVFTAA
ncbi:hypothetical protein GFY24_05870 [Nocardia sp. SYP-A9097]|uniref:hypothetical protein n=1 Tax=Nocardia sp. SYP-A9097 TaxID=2663237 RepID=UPI00129B141C|nr:hypothetical protein [Nocardia sp. SYP-A9097]MRH86997.1 hypothetical protein [Nocardia sp. SYP-A9097]